MATEASVSQASSRNLLIRALDAAGFAALRPSLQRTELGQGEVIGDSRTAIRSVYFLEHGIVTLSDVYERNRIGIAHIGFEGMIGWPVLLGSTVSPYHARVTASGGIALRIASSDLVALCETNRQVRDLLLRFVQAVFVQMQQTIVSSLTQPVETRLCRWTLMAQDRVGQDRIEVTHDEIAVMLAVRRATITDILHKLEGERLIRSERGNVVVVDREGLLLRAGQTYGPYEAEYSRLIAPFPV